MRVSDGTLIGPPPGWRWGCALGVYACSLAFFALLVVFLTGYLDPGDVLIIACFVVIGPTAVVAVTSAHRGRTPIVRATLGLSAVLIVGAAFLARTSGPSSYRAQLDAVHLPATLEFTFANENTSIGDVGLFFARNYIYRGDDPVSLLHEIAAAFSDAGFRRPTIEDDPSDLDRYGPGLSITAHRRGALVEASVERNVDGTYAVAVVLRP